MEKVAHSWVIILLVSGVILASFSACKRAPQDDSVWNRDGLDKIVDLEPTELDLTPTKRERNKLVYKLEIEEETEEEEFYCNA